MATGGGDENLLSVTKLVIVKAHEILGGLVNDDSLTLSEKEKIVASRQQYQVLHDRFNELLVAITPVAQ